MTVEIRVEQRGQQRPYSRRSFGPRGEQHRHDAGGKVPGRMRNWFGESPPSKVAAYQRVQASRKVSPKKTARGGPSTVSSLAKTHALEREASPGNAARHSRRPAPDHSAGEPGSGDRRTGYSSGATREPGSGRPGPRRPGR